VISLPHIIAAGMREWSAAEWGVFFGAIVTLAAGVTTLAVLPILGKIKEIKAQNAGQQQQINDVKSDVRNVTSAAMTTPTPTTEQIAAAVNREQGQ
jgi:type II secretory pathway component PulM